MGVGGGLLILLVVLAMFLIINVFHLTEWLWS
jgi:hypothetical protein